MTLSPTPRLIILLGLGLPVAIVVGIVAPSAWPWVPLAMLVVCLAALFDGVLAPLGKGLAVKLALPRSLGIGRNADAGIEVRFGTPDQKGRAPRRIELRLGLNRVLAGSTYDRQMAQDDDHAFRGRLHVHAKTRGRGDVQNAWVRWQGALGLVHVQKKVALDARTIVTPDLKGVQQDAANLFSLDSIYGIRVQNQLHTGSEYHALREYDASQDHRRIDWRSSSRHMKLYSREYQAERNHHIVLVYDTGRLMGEPLKGLKRLDRAIHAGLLLGYCALKVGDNIRTFAFASRPYHAAPMISGTQGFEILKHQLSVLEAPTEGLGTAIVDKYLALKRADRL